MLVVVGGSLLALSSGCGDDLGVEIDASASNVCSEIAEVACHNLYQCCTEGEIENYLRVDEARTEMQCRDDFRRACSRATLTIQDSLSKGRVRFDSELMNTCLQSLVAPEETCGQVVDALPWTEACMNTAWVGIVAAGNECRFPHDCAGGIDATCGPTQRCIAKPTQGQPCGTGCASAFYCAGASCQQRLPAGAMCASEDQCQEALSCDYSATPAICVARGGGGSSCSSPAGCLSGQCTPGTCSGGGTCFRDTDCPRQCSNSPAFCNESYQCGAGRCAQSQATCSFPSDCGVSDTCVLPGQCLPATCQGDRVCTAPQFTIDYCEDTVQQLPAF